MYKTPFPCQNSRFPEAEGRVQCRREQDHLLCAQLGDERPDSRTTNHLNVVEVDGTIPRHAIYFGERDLRRYTADRRGDWGHRDLTQEIQSRVAGEYENWNSPRFGGFRRYPSRCFRSSSRSFDRVRAARKASRVNPDRVVPSLFAIRSTASTSSASSVICTVRMASSPFSLFQ